MNDELELSERDQLLSVFNGFAEMITDRDNVRMVLDAEEETWDATTNHQELLERLELLGRRSQLTDRQRALTVLLRGRLRKHEQKKGDTP